MPHTNDQLYLHQALDLAKIRRGYCAPNPSVGSVIVLHNKVIATGYHYAAGHSHAEIDALKKLGNSASGATVYVTLEPCCHFGRTPPCTEALIKAGVKRVVYGYGDPNPIVSGKGADALMAAGITCEYLPLAEINSFYESYAHWHRTKTPFVTAKIALSLDGKIAGKNGERIQITGTALQEVTHHYRKVSDALLTTAKTIIIDNPQLNARYQNGIIPKTLYVLDKQLNLPLTANIFTTTKSITIFHEEGAPLDRKQQLSAQGANCVALPKEEKFLNLKKIIDLIGQDGVHDLWVEAGGKCFSNFAEQQLLQRALIYIAPHTLGEGLPAFSSKLNLQGQQVAWQQIGQDVLCDIRY